MYRILIILPLTPSTSHAPNESLSHVHVFLFLKYPLALSLLISLVKENKKKEKNLPLKVVRFTAGLRR